MVVDGDEETVGIAWDVVGGGAAVAGSVLAVVGIVGLLLRR